MAFIDYQPISTGQYNGVDPLKKRNLNQPLSYYENPDMVQQFRETSQNAPAQQPLTIQPIKPVTSGISSRALPSNAKDLASSLDLEGFQNDQWVSAAKEKAGTAPAEVDSSVGKDVMNAGQSILQQVFAANAADARNNYGKKMNNWAQANEQQLTSDSRPDVEKMMSNMPSSVEALKRGTNFEGNGEMSVDSAYNPVASATINPAALNLGNDTLTAIANPLSLFDKWMGDGFAGYVGSKAAEGAMGGGLVGGIIGVVEGIFSWVSAKDEDDENSARMYEEYRRRLEEWEKRESQRRENNRLASEEDARQRRVKKRADDEVKAERKAAEQKDDIRTRRASIINAIVNASNVSDAAQNERINRWSR